MSQHLLLEHINCSLSSRAVCFLAHSSSGQSISLDTKQKCMCVRELKSIKEKYNFTYLCMTFRKLFRQHLSLRSCMQLRLKNSSYSSRKMKVLIYKLLNFRNLVSFPFLLTNDFWQRCQGLQSSKFLFEDKNGSPNEST